MKGFLIRGFNANKDYPVNIYRSMLYIEGENLYLKTSDGIFHLSGNISSGDQINLENYYTKLEMDSILDNIQIEGYITVEDLSEYVTNDKLIEEIAKLNQVDFNIDEYLKIEDLDNNVTSIVDYSIAQLIDGAPESFDTLREISDWINANESKTFDLIEQVSLKADKSEIPSIEGLATETFVVNAINDIEIPEPNLSNYYNRGEVDTLIDGVEVDLMINTTHADLLALVNNSELVAGQQYRITDYVATVDESVYNGSVVSFFARSNNHAFDIIVTADSINQLNENARAIRHEGDTYFPSHTKFEVWKLKYTIFNDSERFDWAVSSGKGVIYQLIDEWNNDLPYDFKSIQYKRNDVWVYTFGGIADNSLTIQNCYENKMLRMYSNINTYGYGLNNNTFGDYCHANTLGYGCLANTFGNYCSLNTFRKECSSNTFEGSCISNTFGNDCFSNTFGDSCQSNTFGNNCGQNTLGDNCSSNTFGSYCDSNSFGTSCRTNTFGTSCFSHTFGNNCVSNTFGNSCNSNTFGSECFSNTFGNNCYSNTFGDNCYLNTFGEYGVLNTFGDDYLYYNVSNNVSNKDFTTLISLFTTPPYYNEIRVTTSVNGAVMSQVINATTTESIDI